MATAPTVSCTDMESSHSMRNLVLITPLLPTLPRKRPRCQMPKCVLLSALVLMAKSLPVLQARYVPSLFNILVHESNVYVQ
jgi:hypothetical protein